MSRWREVWDGRMAGVRVDAEYSEDPDRRIVITGVCLSGDPENPITADLLRRFPIGSLEVNANYERARKTGSPSDLPPLQRPTGNDPDLFYETVAAHYWATAVVSRKPAADMAASADVPVTTVHRWIREARIRGWLPEGMRGKAA